MPTIAAALARFVASCEYDAIPQPLRDKARLHLLDSVGVAFASSRFDFARCAHAGLARFGAGEYAAIGMAGRLALRDAALMNGILVHGIEYDDTSILGRNHPSAFCVPTALAMGAFAHASGRELLGAYILGIECAIRISGAARGAFSPAGFNATGVVGGFGAALTAGKLLGASAAQLADAQGIAYSTAAGSREFVTGDAWTKRFDPGWAAVGGITAAMLAVQGYSGPRTPYEGKFGLYRAYLDRPVSADDLGLVTAGLGDTWRCGDLALKALPSCYFNHPIINSAIAVAAKNGIDPQAIERVVIKLPAAAIDTVCEPSAAKYAPGDTASALFSAYYNVASALVRRRLTLADLQPAALRDPQVLALARKVTYVVDTASNFPRHYTGEVEVVMGDGRTLAEREDVNLGSPERPLAEAHVLRKFMDNVQDVLSRERAVALCDVLLDIERMSDVATLDLAGRA